MGPSNNPKDEKTQMKAKHPNEATQEHNEWGMNMKVLKLNPTTLSDKNRMFAKKANFVVRFGEKEDVKEQDKDIQVTFEDQEKINKFARHNAKLQDLKDELASKKKELQNLEDAGDELLMLEDEEAIPYQIGEVFVSLQPDETATMLEEAKVTTKKDIQNIEKFCEDHKQILSDLKVQLYAKFGNNINLEAEEE